MKLSEAIARALVDSGDTTLFGLMGDTNMLFINSFIEMGGRYVPVANEAGAVCMASGYSQVSGKVGVATVIKGPGVTNTLTALSDASRAGSPLVLIAADADIAVRDDLQKVPQREFLQPTGAGIEQLRVPATALEDFREARRRAVAESRPIVLNLPKNYWNAELDYQSPAPIPDGIGHTIPNPDELDAAVGLIASAKRPLILAGRGAAAPRSRDAIRALGERIGAPLTTTLRGKGLFRGAAGDLGLFGGLASDRTTEAIARADCVIAFGASLNYRTTDSGGLLQGKAVVQCDTSRAAIGKYPTVKAGVVGDAGAIADAMVTFLDAIEAKPTSFLAEIDGVALPAGKQPRPSRMPGTADFLDALKMIETSVPANRILTVDNGRFMYSAYKTLTVLDPLCYVHTTSVGSIGLGLGHAIGAALAAPDRPTLLVAGDGGFMNGDISELSTAVNAGIDLIVFVMNDSAFGAEYMRFEERGLDPGPSTYKRPSFAAVARAFGGQGFSVTDESSLRRVPDLIANRRGLLLFDVVLDPAAVVKGAVPE